MQIKKIIIAVLIILVSLGAVLVTFIRMEFSQVYKDQWYVNEIDLIRQMNIGLDILNGSERKALDDFYCHILLDIQEQNSIYNADEGSWSVISSLNNIKSIRDENTKRFIKAYHNKYGVELSEMCLLK